jgi:alkylation response protein AidB-like acyl-CoA dehydrogenase
MLAVEVRPRAHVNLGVTRSILLPGSDHDAVEERLVAGVVARDRAAPGSPSSRDATVGLSRWIDAQIEASGRSLAAPLVDLTIVGQTIASAGSIDMSVAFPLWCHRMVIEYLTCASLDRPALAQAIGLVRAGDIVGSTALAPAIAHVVAGAPLPVTWREEHGGEIVLDGRLRWASNLYPPGCLLVTAAVHAGGGRPILVAIPGDAAGVQVDPYPEILALGATGSSSVRLDGVRISDGWVLTTELRPFIQAIRAPFLLLQSSFALGLARRALDEVAATLRATANPYGAAFAGDASEAEATFARVADFVLDGLATRGAEVPVRDVVRARLDAARLATDAVALEAKVVGGRSYLAMSGTARRLREAAFLPVQAPTEGQLRWELSLSA